MAQPVAIDLFAGAGGFGLGFKMAGFSVPVSLEIDAWACDTLRYNHPFMVVIQEDIRNFNTLSSVTKIYSSKPDIIIGGPPCQGFSIAGPAVKDPKDPRNSLFQKYRTISICRLAGDAQKSVNLIINLQCVVTQHLPIIT
jgi:DNA (cytosine-5)-methyltransferase 1